MRFASYGSGFCAPLANRMGKGEGYGNDSNELGDTVWICDVGVFKVEAARLASSEQGFDGPTAFVDGQGMLWLDVGGNDDEFIGLETQRGNLNDGMCGGLF